MVFKRYLNVYSGVVPLPVVYIVRPLRSLTLVTSPLLSSIYNTPSVLIPTTDTLPLQIIIKEWKETI